MRIKCLSLGFLLKSPVFFTESLLHIWYNKPLKELKIKENCLIGCIIRQNEVIIPGGSDCIKRGDHVIVVTTHKNFDDLTDVFE